MYVKPMTVQKAVQALGVTLKMAVKEDLLVHLISNTLDTKV
jgi:hypothetical protein